MERMNEEEVERALARDWDALLARSASAAADRFLAEKRWEKRLRTVRYAALAVGAFLVVQFPIACYALGSLEETAAAYCAAL